MNLCRQTKDKFRGVGKIARCRQAEIRRARGNTPGGPLGSNALSPLLGPPSLSLPGCCHGHRFRPGAAANGRGAAQAPPFRVTIGWEDHVTQGGMLIYGNRPRPSSRAVSEQPAGCAAPSRRGGLRGGPGRERPGGGGARGRPQVNGRARARWGRGLARSDRRTRAAALRA